jgi:hypothetical protein
MAQLADAPVSETGCCGFDSHSGHHLRKIYPMSMNEITNAAVSDSIDRRAGVVLHAIPALLTLAARQP